MAEGLTFDDLDPAWKPPRPGEPGAPAVPISKPQASDYALAPPKVPISGPQASDYEGLTFNDLLPPTDAQKSVARIRDIAKSKLDRQPWVPGPLDHIADAYTRSVSRPVSALAGTIYDKIAGNYPEASADEIYQANIGYMNDRARQAEKNTPFAPVVGALAQMPLTLATGGGSGFRGVGGGTAPASTGRVMMQAGREGAIEGAAQHADTPMNAIEGGIVGGGLSAGTAGVIDQGVKHAMPAAQRGLAAEARAAKGIDPNQVRTDASNFYTQMDNAGVRYDAHQTAPLYTGLHDMQTNLRFSPSANPALRAPFRRAMQLSRNEMSYSELQDIRSAIAEQTRNADASTRRAAGEMLGHVDRVIRDVPAVNPQGLDMATNHRQASSLWRTANLAADIDYKGGKAGRMVDAGKDINPDAKMRDDLFNYRERINDPKRPYNPLDNNQRALLDRAIEGRTSTNLKRTAGDFLVNNARGLGATVGTGLGLTGFIHGNSPGWSLATAAAGVPIWATSHFAGRGLQGSAAAGRQADISALLRDIKGSAPPVPGAAIDRNDLVKILFAQDLARMAPRVGSQEIGNPKKKEEKK